mmetsp:Transcript_10722/g.15972  ORF Transcript_10722/g.15972 Transcript_10722/m.15972 type:complete len:168 (+) Transcript_10722:142-645(+)|eukprot:CAMPEP_0167748112 /NCGR_PEP_ID=MMETSP0110_2-20121227/4660_1 /TAXON_ID=629695 /ORGANISM="Gymnochlora sp., Strain CCMP2014" /LENGTH=167 /DNA_ID=CAMNT_0007633097 /DNA_START=46 /DNA_END=549 /DNA_ORIENTATION=+
MRTSTLFAVFGLAFASIEFSRNIDYIEKGSTATVTLDSGCSAKDQYGSNNCKLEWGSSYTVNVAAKLGETLYSNSTIAVSLTVDGFIPYDFNCPVCGSNCTITIPVIKKEVSFSLPACPLDQFNLNQNFTLPSDSPIPFQQKVTGKATVSNGLGTHVAIIDIDATLA